MKTLSIVIPAYNEEKTLQKCVERVLALADNNIYLEIIIVDDASKDKTAEVAKSLADRYKLNFSNMRKIRERARHLERVLNMRMVI